MRHILLNSAVAVVAATLGTSAFGADGADMDHDKTQLKTSTTQPAHVEVQSETDINDSAMPAGATIHADDRGGTVDTSVDTDRSDDAIKARTEIDGDQKAQLKADKDEAKAELKESKKDLKHAEAEYKADKKDYDRTTAEMERKTDRANGVGARAEVDTDNAQTAGSVEVDGEARRTESRPEGSDKEHLQNENPEKPHLSDK